MSFIKKLGKIFKRAAPIGLGLAGASLIPGVGGALGGALGGLFGGSGTTADDNSGAPPAALPTFGQQMGNAASSVMDFASKNAPLLSAGAQYIGQRNTNAANAQQAQNQMNFEREMSNTSYQRATADMKAAGLNPMLAYSQGGASTPGGAQAQMQNDLGEGANSAFSAMKTMQELETARLGMELTRKEIDDKDADIRNKDANSALSLAQAANQPLIGTQIGADTEYTKARTSHEGIRLRWADDLFGAQLAASNSAAMASRATAESVAGKWRSERDLNYSLAGKANADRDYTVAGTGERRARSDAAAALLPHITSGGNAIGNIRDFLGSNLGGWLMDGQEFLGSLPDKLRSYGRR